MQVWVDRGTRHRRRGADLQGLLEAAVRSGVNYDYHDSMYHYIFICQVVVPPPRTRAGTETRRGSGGGGGVGETFAPLTPDSVSKFCRTSTWTGDGTRVPARVGGGGGMGSGEERVHTNRKAPSPYRMNLVAAGRVVCYSVKSSR